MNDNNFDYPEKLLTDYLSTFDFQNLIKLDYTPSEDDIIQKIEIGNVSMPISSSLISGAQNLFGLKTQLKFGNTTIDAVLSEQRSQSKTLSSKSGDIGISMQTSSGMGVVLARV